MISIVRLWWDREVLSRCKSTRVENVKAIPELMDSRQENKLV